MKKRLTIILITTFIVSLIITVGLTKLMFLNDTNSMSGILYVFVVANHIVMAISTLPIYLNLYKKVRINFAYSLLTFIFLPLAIKVGTVFIRDDVDWKFIVIYGLPYLSILIINFIIFRKSKILNGIQKNRKIK